MGVSHIYEDITTQIHILNETVPTGLNLGLNHGVNKTMAFEKKGGIVLKTWTDPPSFMLATVYILFKEDYATTNYIALNCSLHPSVNTYATIIRNSVLEEGLVDVVLLRSLSAQFAPPPVTDKGFEDEVV